jgi:hypothetical protein
MPNISGNILDKFNQICSTLHQESNKIEFAFFRFFYDFLEILQESAKWLYYWSCGFTPRSLQRSTASKNALGLHKNPRKDPEPCNVALGVGVARLRPNPARSAALPIV